MPAKAKFETPQRASLFRGDKCASSVRSVRCRYANGDKRRVFRGRLNAARNLSLVEDRRRPTGRPAICGYEDFILPARRHAYAGQAIRAHDANSRTWRALLTAGSLRTDWATLTYRSGWTGSAPCARWPWRSLLAFRALAAPGKKREQQEDGYPPSCSHADQTFQTGGSKIEREHARPKQNGCFA